MWSPKSENGTVKKIGSGFHDGPPSVTRSKWAISRPHMIQAQGSYVGVEGVRRLKAATTRQATRITGIEPARRISSRVAGAPAPGDGSELAESASRLRSGRSCAA